LKAGPTTRHAAGLAGTGIKLFAGINAAEWDDYVRRAGGATFCHLSGWARVVERTWGHRSYYLSAEREGAVVGVLPLFHVSSRLFGSMLVSTPNAIYGGVVADDVQVRQALITEAKRLATQLCVDYLELRDGWNDSDGAADEELCQKDLYVSFEHPLTPDDEALLRSLPKKLRNMVRKGQAYGLTSEVGRLELLDEFYEVFATNMRNLGTPVYPKQLFAQFLLEFPEHCDILLVRQKGRVAGGTMNFYFRDTVLPHYAAAYREFYRAGVSNFMFWEVMRRAAARKYARFDFGRSKRNSGSWAFKRTWGMNERPLPYKYFLVRAPHVPNLNPTNPTYALIIAAWKRLPVWMTKLLGPGLVKNIP
jgi:FemAB-related protein (PEP-CTERM system-associated)